MLIELLQTESQVRLIMVVAIILWVLVDSELRNLTIGASLLQEKRSRMRWVLLNRNQENKFRKNHSIIYGLLL